MTLRNENSESQPSDWPSRVLVLSPLIFWLAAFPFSWITPAIVYDDSDWSALDGRFDVSPAVIRQFESKGTLINNGDWLCRFWGGMGGDPRGLIVVWAREGLLIARADQYGAFRGWLVVRQPLIACLAVGLSGALWMVVRRIRNRWRHPWQCRDCGYCLIGNVSGVCPECGLYCEPAQTVVDA